MNKTVTICAMTEKGHAVVRHVAEHYPDLLHQVIIGSDCNIADDFSERIEALCRSARIPHVRRDRSVEPKGEICLAVSWRWLIDLPPDRLIVLHDSLLPRYRGFAPLVNALIRGEPEIGVTALFGAEEYDRGDVIYQASTPINYPITIEEAIKRNMSNYIRVVGWIFDCLRKGKPLPSHPQNENQATYSIWRDESDYRIDWSAAAEEIRRLVDAVGHPYAGARTSDGRHEIVVDAVEEVPDVSCELRHSGKVIFVEGGCPIVICGSGLLKILSARYRDAAGNYQPYVSENRFRIRFA